MNHRCHFLLALSLLLVWLAGFAHAAQTLTLVWNASASPEVAGYNIYYGTNCGSYSCKTAVSNVTTMTVSNLTAGVTYYFAVTAYDANGNESGYSAEVSYTLDGVLTLSQGTNPGDPALIQFPVEPGHWYEVQATTDLQSWATVWQTDVADANVWLQFADPEAGAFSSQFYRLVLH